MRGRSLVVSGGGRMRGDPSCVPDHSAGRARRSPCLSCPSTATAYSRHARSAPRARTAPTPALPAAPRRRRRRALAHRGQRRVPAGALGAAVSRRGGLLAPGDRAARVARLRLASARAGRRRPAPGLHPGQPLRPRPDAPAAARARGPRQRPRRPARRLAAACGRRSGGDGLRLRPALRPRGPRPRACCCSTPAG